MTRSALVELLLQTMRSKRVPGHHHSTPFLVYFGCGVGPDGKRAFGLMFTYSEN
ncbi:hypothetical protein COLO4_34030 [Corchorus olitorius]|uniref:Uncharacterized protein n=1 Tax=Corchorus olitorius TaxID=93759 RepID=A0A1R3GP31_9ROSI|nr:hypothetical protein COLO4_34030 [Corchorus olitorius]